MPPNLVSGAAARSRFTRCVDFRSEIGESKRFIDHVERDGIGVKCDNSKTDAIDRDACASCQAIGKPILS